MVKCARKTDALALPARKPDTAFTYVGIKASRQFRFDEIEYLRHRGGLAQARTINFIVRHPERNIASDRIVDKEKFLRDIADRSLPRRNQFGSKRLAINEHPSAGRPVQSKQEV